jgi:hypothetical protein
METVLRTVGVHVVRTPASAPNCNAHAERFIRSIKTECLERVVPLTPTPDDCSCWSIVSAGRHAKTSSCPFKDTRRAVVVGETTQGSSGDP